SGRRAPEHPSVPNTPDFVVREAYSHEVSSAGFWPGSAAAPEPVFYSYAYPRFRLKSGLRTYLRMVVECLRDRRAPPEGGLGGGPPAWDLWERDLRPGCQIDSTPVHFLAPLNYEAQILAQKRKILK